VGHWLVCVESSLKNSYPRTAVRALQDQRGCDRL